MTLLEYEPRTTGFRVEPFLAFIIERETIRVLKERGDLPPWTADPILQAWSFTNIHREDDRTTRWIANNWRTPNADDPDLWFAMVVARFVNWPDTLADIGYPVPWDGDRFLTVMSERKARGEKQYNEAYMLRAGPTGLDKSFYQSQKVFDPLWRARERIRPRPAHTLAEFNGTLARYHGLGGGFMSAQVVADVKQVAPLLAAAGWWDWAGSGPGSRRGMYRILGKPFPARNGSGQPAPWNEYTWLSKLRQLQEQVNPALDAVGIGPLCAQDLQSCLCEWDKYERTRLGEGTPKRRYRPSS
jgi:hypothetical protein